MTRWIGITKDGQAVRDTVTDRKPEQAGIVFMETDTLADVDVVTQYWNGNAFIDKGAQPTPHHAFDYTLKRWVADTSAAWSAVKYQRSRLLADSDWVVTKAGETGQLVPPAWMTYRQALRDVTLQADPWAIVWPVAPSN